jgi:hypothetical protein
MRQMSHQCPITPEFTLSFPVNLNATQAAIRAGYSKKTAHQQGPLMLEDVGIQKRIQQLMNRRSEHTEVTAPLIGSGKAGGHYCINRGIGKSLIL